MIGLSTEFSEGDTLPANIGKVQPLYITIALSALAIAQANNLRLNVTLVMNNKYNKLNKLFSDTPVNKFILGLASLLLPFVRLSVGRAVLGFAKYRMRAFIPACSLLSLFILCAGTAHAEDPAIGYPKQMTLFTTEANTASVPLVATTNGVSIEVLDELGSRLAFANSKTLSQSVSLGLGPHRLQFRSVDAKGASSSSYVSFSVVAPLPTVVL